MPRKRVTELIPFLLPLRQWQRKTCCCVSMRLDGNRYAERISDGLLPELLFETSFRMVNESSGFDIRYQYNKVHNLKLAAATMDRVLIRPGETFSFFRLARHAQRHEPYRDALSLHMGKIVPARGGGLCMLSDLLFWCFLHTPLTIVERHGHSADVFPPSLAQGQPCGTDATISEGWRDLKLRNDTDSTFQLEIAFDDERIYGRIRADRPADREYRVYNDRVCYIRRNGRVYQRAEVWREETNRTTGAQTCRKLYTNECEIAYPLPADTRIEEESI